MDDRSLMGKSGGTLTARAAQPRFMVCSKMPSEWECSNLPRAATQARLYCGPEGLYLGPAPLIEHYDGTYRLRSKEEIAALLAAAYEPAPDVANHFPGLCRVVAALQEGDLSRAMISALYLRLVEVSEDAIARLAKTEALLKANFNPAQARDQHGRWTMDGSSSSTGERTSANHPALMPAQEILPFGARPPLFFEEPPKTFRPFKEPIPRLSGKEGSKQIPSWARGNRPYVGESGRQFAKRLMDEQYGRGSWEQSRGREYNQLKKYGDRNFRDPLSILSPDDRI